MLKLQTPRLELQLELFRLNIEDLQLLHDWHMGNDTKFSDHEAEEQFRQDRGSEIDLGFKHPYGEFSADEDR
jgi:hypothetical protein